MKKKSELLVRLYMVVGAFALVAVLIFYRVVKEISGEKKVMYT